MQHPSCAPRTDWLELGQDVLNIEIEGLKAVRDRLNGPFVDAVTLLAQCAGRVVVTGLGKSGLVGRKLAATFSSTGTPSFFLHPVEGAHGDLGMIRNEDVVLAISNSGETDELNAVLPTMRSLGVSIVSLTGRPDSTMGRLSDVVIDTGVPREACPLDLAPTASTTAALAVGDALAVCLIHWKSFTADDFRKYHPGGSLGQRLSLRVSSLMHADAPCAPESVSIRQALEVLDAGRLGAVILTDAAGRLSGIITDGDVRRMLCRGIMDMDAPAHTLMVRSPLHATPAQSVAELLDVMEARAITVLPVVQPDMSLAGVIHLHDLLGKGGVKFSGR
ncbi:KpsF/GutQ family sugar-phosphate isomerase [Desulfovibrio psychrotolerans]|uniref:Carbohydrate isomerase KpsF/GutQ family protein n=1 Tax=Desulfovibrio psychrotolerans TaxID=415242 RepID=A0A7J0BY23_9BACT|nr:KpsF/GutQ family sugar-phosphate isomerase [Desulfovibrio psychrotolerans]GFM38583.1 carbohydrate isomerase KpsF/GutQ family protein [Desulfovibrio psychrotolerans]